MIGVERAHVVGRWWQANNVKMNAAKPGAVVGGCFALGSTARVRARGRHGRRSRRRMQQIRPRLAIRQRLPRPMLGIRRARRDPRAHRIDLCARQRHMPFDGRHPLIRVRAHHSRKQLALLGLPRHDGRAATLAALQRTIALVEAQAGLAARGIRTVALKAARGQDGCDIAREVDGGRGRRHRCRRAGVPAYLQSAGSTTHSNRRGKQGVKQRRGHQRRYCPSAVPLQQDPQQDTAKSTDLEPVDHAISSPADESAWCHRGAMQARNLTHTTAPATPPVPPRSPCRRQGR